MRNSRGRVDMKQGEVRRGVSKAQIAWWEKRNCSQKRRRRRICYYYYYCYQYMGIGYVSTVWRNEERGRLCNRDEGMRNETRGKQLLSLVLPKTRPAAVAIQLCCYTFVFEPICDETILLLSLSYSLPSTLLIQVGIHSDSDIEHFSVSSMWS